MVKGLEGKLLAEGLYLKVKQERSSYRKQSCYEIDTI